MSYAVTVRVAVAALPGVGPLGRRLLAILASFADDDGRNAYPSIAGICAAHGIAERSARKAIRQLCGKGYIVDVGKRGVCVNYTIDLLKVGHTPAPADTVSASTPLHQRTRAPEGTPAPADTCTRGHVTPAPEGMSPLSASAPNSVSDSVSDSVKGEDLAVLPLKDVDAIIAAANARHVKAGTDVRKIGRLIVDELAEQGIGRTARGGEVKAWTRDAVMRRLTGAIVAKPVGEILAYWAKLRVDAGLGEDMGAESVGRKRVQSLMMPRCGSDAERDTAVEGIKTALRKVLLDSWHMSKGHGTLAWVCANADRVTQLRDSEPSAPRRAQPARQDIAKGWDQAAPQFKIVSTPSAPSTPPAHGWHAEVGS